MHQLCNTDKPTKTYRSWLSDRLYDSYFHNDRKFGQNVTVIFTNVATDDWTTS